MNAICTPIELALGLAAGQISKKVFDFVWGLVEGTIARAGRGIVDHGTRGGWARLTGAWPGEERPEEE